jgi:two-component system, sensor histidine kinase PdtaS
MQRKNERFVERLPLTLPRPIYGYLLSALFCGIALGLRLAAQSFMPIGYPFVSFFPAVILSTFLFGIRPGIFAAILCGLLSWYFFMPASPAGGFDGGLVLPLLFYAAVVAIDIALINLMQRANFNLAVERERSRALAENRELLFHELQHRVSNNLQVVAAMLSLQRRHIDHEQAARALDDAASRLALVGRISRALYDPSEDRQDLHAFLTKLTEDVVEASGREDINVAVSAPQNLKLDSNVAVPLALIVAEAVSNAIEHGLPHRGGLIEVTLEDASGTLTLKIADDGRGIASDFEIDKGSSIGLRIASALAGQLSGKFALHPRPEGGAVVRLDLPVQAR